MQTFISHKSKQLFVFVVKLAIVIVAAYFIYDRLAHDSALSFKNFTAQIEKNPLFTPLTILALFVATFLNWFLEIVKWKTLVAHLKNISIWESTSHTLGSLTASLFTPNRVGEYGAKALFFEKSVRKKVVGLNFLGNMAQLLLTLVFGVVGLLGIVIIFSIEIPWNLMLQLTIGSVFILGILIGLVRLKPFKKLLRSWRRLYNFFVSVSGEIHFKNLSLATARYLVFAHQFYGILYLFDSSIPYGITMCLIAAMYLLTSLIPMLFIFDVLVKGSVAVWLFSHINVPELTILSVIALMWICNFVIPSMLGSYFVMTFSLPAEKKSQLV